MGPRGEPGLPGSMGPPGPQGPNGLSLPGEPVSALQRKTVCSNWVLMNMTHSITILLYELVLIHADGSLQFV